MANMNTISTLEINGQSYAMKPCWEKLGITQAYFVALLSRDEYAPVAIGKPNSTNVSYTDPASGNVAYFHAGQCVVYPDSEVADGWGLSIVKCVVTNEQNVPVSVAWYHATDTEKRLEKLEAMNGYWVNGPLASEN